MWVQAQQAQQAWWTEATAMPGMSPHHREMTGFLARQWLDATSPSNAGLANPEVLQRTLASGGANLLHGAARALDEWRQAHGLPALAHDTALAPAPEPAAGQPTAPARPYHPGVDVAITSGKVVHRNALVELIQYLPTTPRVQAEPVFIVPSWIMKYYILDLSPHNSLVRWLVSQGHTVFILSWRNPDEADALLSMDDYLALGIFDCLARPQRVDGAELLAPLASVSLLAAETDFSEPGEMGVLIDEAQVAMLEDQMAERGFLTGPQMAGSFAYLHSRELVWTRRLRTMWLDEPDSPNDLMAWNADTTRMPALMHSQYLRRCYLHNDIANGRFPVGG
ncbi:MAG: poly-beta-hydroxybutyrate polymerase, partial [Burkholderiales bacterium PBB5]